MTKFKPGNANVVLDRLFDRRKMLCSASLLFTGIETKTMGQEKGPVTVHDFYPARNAIEDDMQPRFGFSISTAEQLKYYLTARKKLQMKVGDFGRSVQADYFLFLQRKGDHEAASKLGGLPFVDPSFEWPVHRGDPLTFIGQVCLVDSSDIISNDVDVDVVAVFADAPTPGIVVGLPSRLRTGSLCDNRTIPNRALRLPEFSAIRTRIPVYPDYSSVGLYVDDLSDSNICFPLGMYVCSELKTIQPQATYDSSIAFCMMGGADFNGVEVSDIAPKDDSERIHFSELMDWISLGAGGIRVEMRSSNLSLSFEMG